MNDPHDHNTKKPGKLPGFFISAISLNTSLTVGISTFLSITSLSIWLINIANTFKYIVYTPLWYLDYCFIKTNSDYYINSLDQINYNKNLGLLITLIIAIVFYIATNVVYSIRDIKNKQSWKNPTFF